MTKSWLAMCLILAIGCDRPKFKRPVNLVYLEQGPRWGPRERAIYYYTPQGTMLHGLRYRWFQHLITADGHRLAEPSYLRRFGFLYSPEQFNPNYDGALLNPGNFPVGFAQRQDESGEAMLDITCAACHTGQLEYKGTALRVDGGPALHALAWIKTGQFLTDLIGALATTYADPFKFDKFAQLALGTRYPEAKPELRQQLADTLSAFNREAISTYDLFSDDGYGRIDALGHIANTVFGDDIAVSNHKVANAPVNYPHVWDIWKFDWVQWNGSVAQPMGRNVGEALGVKARLDLVDRAGDRLPDSEIYNSSVLLHELDCVETTLQQLGPPQWPEPLFPVIDKTKAVAGKLLFENNCKHCHGPHIYPDEQEAFSDYDFAALACSGEENEQLIAFKGRTQDRYECGIIEGDRQPSLGKPVEWKLCLVPEWRIGTDPQVVNNFLDLRYDASVLDLNQPGYASISAGEALNVITGAVIRKKYEELGIDCETQWKMNGWGRTSEVRDIRGYKSRPLHGIWATPPFLHNGSVRTIFQLLSPYSERQKRFWVGSREYDPIHLGYRDIQVEAAFELDTTSEGNTNTGHLFTDAGGRGVIGRGLSPQERFEIIEYLKTLGHPKYDSNYTEYVSVEPGPPRCDPARVQGPATLPEARWPQ